MQQSTRNAASLSAQHALVCGAQQDQTLRAVSNPRLITAVMRCGVRAVAAFLHLQTPLRAGNVLPSHCGFGA